jgi:hypothetical protein
MTLRGWASVVATVAVSISAGGLIGHGGIPYWVFVLGVCLLGLSPILLPLVEFARSFRSPNSP